MKIENLIRFSKFLDKFRKVERTILVNGTKRNENDVEHSYMLALLAWYICSTEKLSLDVDKVIKYALAHDLVEVYAGDTHFFHASKEESDSKREREQAAVERIAEEFPEFSGLKDLFTSYEDKADPEARFVYALDKVQPVLMIYLDGGKTWNRDKVTLDMLIDKKTDKIAHSPEIKEYWEQFVAILKAEKASLFE